MNPVVYNSKYIFNGEKFIEIEKFDFKSNKIIVFNVKELFSIFIKKKIKFDINLICGLEYMNTSMDIDMNSLGGSIKINAILNTQSQNLNRSYDFIPDNFLQKMMLEQYQYLQDKIKGVNIDIECNKYHNTMSHMFAKLEQKNDIPINFKVYGTITGRVSHEYITKNKDFIKKKLGDSIYEFDFKAFEVTNIRNFFHMPFLPDPYSIKKFDRNVLKSLIISKVYGMADENLIKKYGEEVRPVINKINEEYKQLFEFKLKLIHQANQNRFITLPLSELKIRYTPDEKIENKVVNNFFQGLSADVMKLKLFRLYRQYKKSKDVIIMFPVHDSFYIRVKNQDEIPNIIQNLEEDLKIKNFNFKNKVEVTKL
jgi:hypothetical protein